MARGYSSTAEKHKARIKHVCRERIALQADLSRLDNYPGYCTHVLQSRYPARRAIRSRHHD